MLRKILYIFVLLFFFSCAIQTKDDEEYPEYKSNKVWELDLSLENILDEKTQYDRYLYAVEWDKESKEGYISKIDLYDGKRVWKSDYLFGDSFYTSVDAQLLEHEDTIYILIDNQKESKRILYILDDEGGILKASVRLNETTEEYDEVRATGVLFFYKNCFYWVRNKLCKLSLDHIDFSKDAKEEQIVKPEFLWTDERNKMYVIMFPVQHKNILYFQTYDYYGYHKQYSTRSRIIAYDLEDDRELWGYNCKKLYGYGFDNMKIVGDKLYIIEQGIGCFDLKTGECFHESFQTREDLMHQDDIAGGIYSDGIAYHDGKFFYTNTTSWGSSDQTGIPLKNLHNIICLDAKTLKMVWGVLPKGSGSQTACPTVLNGKVFVPLWLRGLCVLDEKTGKILGIDTSIIDYGGGGIGANYNGLAMFFDYSHYEKDGLVTLMAIRP